MPTNYSVTGRKEVKKWVKVNKHAEMWLMWNYKNQSRACHCKTQGSETPQPDKRYDGKGTPTPKHCMGKPLWIPSQGKTECFQRTVCYAWWWQDKGYSEYAVCGLIFPPDYAEYFGRKRKSQSPTKWNYLTKHGGRHYKTLWADKGCFLAFIWTQSPLKGRAERP